MVMSWIFSAMILTSVACAALLGNGSALAAAAASGAQAGITLTISMAGSICLWSGVGKLMDRGGITAAISRMIRPLLHLLFPTTRIDPVLAGHLAGNICANFLGLGNAATPMGIRAVQQMATQAEKNMATDEMCRFIVLNTASIQLIPATVAAVRASLGSVAPFDILPAVWVTSLCSAGLGVAAATLLGKVWHDD